MSPVLGLPLLRQLPDAGVHAAAGACSRHSGEEEETLPGFLATVVVVLRVVNSICLLGFILTLVVVPPGWSVSTTAACGTNLFFGTAIAAVQVRGWVFGTGVRQEIGNVYFIWRTSNVVVALSMLLTGNDAAFFTLMPFLFFMYLMVGSVLRNLAGLPGMENKFWSPGGILDASVAVLMVFGGIVQEHLSNDPSDYVFWHKLLFVMFVPLVFLQLLLSEAFAGVLSELRQTRSATQQVVSGVCDATFTLNNDLSIAEPSPQLGDLLCAGSSQTSGAELCGRNMKGFVSSADASRIRSAMRLCQKGSRVASALPLDLIGFDQKKITVDMFHAPVNQSQHLVALRVRDDAADVGGAASSSISADAWLARGHEVAHGETTTTLTSSLGRVGDDAQQEQPCLSSLASWQPAADEARTIVAGDSVSVVM